MLTTVDVWRSSHCSYMQDIYLKLTELLIYLRSVLFSVADHLHYHKNFYIYSASRAFLLGIFSVSETII
jgi:hypothetical protein